MATIRMQGSAENSGRLVGHQNNRSRSVAKEHTTGSIGPIENV